MPVYIPGTSSTLIANPNNASEFHSLPNAMYADQTQINYFTKRADGTIFWGLASWTFNWDDFIKSSGIKELGTDKVGRPIYRRIHRAECINQSSRRTGCSCPRVPWFREHLARNPETQKPRNPTVIVRPAPDPPRRATCGL